jgi:hypothetical protein
MPVDYIFDKVANEYIGDVRTDRAVSSMLTINTSNSSKHLNGASIASQSAMINDTVENDLSPPESDLVLLFPP